MIPTIYAAHTFDGALMETGTLSPRPKQFSQAKLIMLSDAIRLAAHLGESRVRTSLEVWPGMFHVWHLFAGLLPEADQALRNAVRFLDDALQAGAH